MPEFWTKHFDQEYPLHLPPQNVLKTFKNYPFRQLLCHVHSCDRNVFRFRPHQTTIEVDRLSSVSEIVVWLRETNKDPESGTRYGSPPYLESTALCQPNDLSV